MLAAYALGNDIEGVGGDIAPKTAGGGNSNGRTKVVERQVLAIPSLNKGVVDGL